MMTPPQLQIFLDRCILLLGDDQISKEYEIMQQYVSVLDEIVFQVLPQIQSPDVLSILSSYVSEVNATITSRLDQNSESPRSVGSDNECDLAPPKKKHRRNTSHTSSLQIKKRKRKKKTASDSSLQSNSTNETLERPDRIRSWDSPKISVEEGREEIDENSSVALTIRNTEELSEICKKMKNENTGVTIKTRRNKLNTISDCFVASEAVCWLQTTLSLSKDNAINICQQLMDKGMIVAQTSTSQSFKDKNTCFLKFSKDYNDGKPFNKLPKKNVDIIPEVSSARVTRQRSRSVEPRDSPFLSAASVPKLPIGLSTTQPIGKDHRKAILLKRATETMKLADIFTFGFLVAKTVNSFSGLSNIINDQDASHIKPHGPTTLDKQGSVRSKLVRTSMMFVKPKKSMDKGQVQPVDDNTREKNHIDTITDFERFLALAQAFQPKNQILSSHSNDSGDEYSSTSNVWRIIFYQYIQDLFSASGTQRESKIKYILTQDNIIAMYNALTHYLTFNGNYIQKKFLPIAVELVEFFSSSTTDPYSTLIGHSPSRRVVTQILHEKLSNPLHCTAIPGSLIVIKVKKVTTTNEGEQENKNQQENQDSEDNSESIINFSATTPVNNESCSSYMYGRCVHTVNNQIYVSTSVYSTRKTVAVEGSDCYDLPNDLRGEINRASEWNIFGLDNFIENPLDELYRNLMFVETEKVIRKYLALQGIDLSVISRAIFQDVTLADVYELHHGNEVCLSIIEEKPKELIEQVKNAINLKIQDFFVNVSKEKLFMPTLATRRIELQNIYSQAIPAISRQIAGNCSGCLDQLKLDRRDLLSGKTKDELVEWWLTEIEKQTNSLLASFAYQFDALPDDYIQEAPADMKLVNANLTALAEAGKSSKLPIMIKSLQELIYPQIDAFLTNSKAVLSAQLGLDLRAFDVAAVTQLFKEKEEELKKTDNSEALLEWIGDSIEDISYLCEMRKLEEPEYAATNSNPHIVPVSGLVYGVFARLENEHRTAAELWDHLQDTGESVLDTEPIVQPKQIREALRAKNFKLAETLLDRVDFSTEKYFDVNEKDPNTGSTILHDCIYLSQFKFAQKILKMKGVQVNTLDKDKNVPIHCCMSCSGSSSRADQVKLFKKLISAGVPVNASNVTGETPLHSAALCGNTKLCKLFLDSNANLNILTKKTEESALHYAVRSGVPSTVKLLLLAKADPVSRSPKGETPLDIAVRLKNSAILSVIQDTYT